MDTPLGDGIMLAPLARLASLAAYCGVSEWCGCGGLVVAPHPTTVENHPCETDV